MKKNFKKILFSIIIIIPSLFLGYTLSAQDTNPFQNTVPLKNGTPLENSSPDSGKDSSGGGSSVGERRPSFRPRFQTCCF